MDNHEATWADLLARARAETRKSAQTSPKEDQDRLTKEIERYQKKLKIATLNHDRHAAEDALRSLMELKAQALAHLLEPYRVGAQIPAPILEQYIKEYSKDCVRLAAAADTLLLSP